MLYRMITSIEKEVGRIAGNASAHADLMARELTARWRDQLPKEQKVVDLHQAQNCLRNDLHQLRHEIRVIEKEHLEVLETTRLGREVRDVAIPQLRGSLVGIQRLFEGTFGAGSSDRVFGAETVSIPYDAFPLRRLGQIVYQRLTDPALVLPEVQLAGVKITPRALAKSFEEPLHTLEEALQELEDNLPVTNASLERKLRTLAESRKQAGIVARFLEALYHLAGHSEIAQRVRLSSRRTRNAGDEATETPAPEEPSTPEEEASTPTEEAAAEAASADVAAPVVEAPAAGAQDTPEEVA